MKGEGSCYSLGEISPECLSLTKLGWPIEWHMENADHIKAEKRILYRCNCRYTVKDYLSHNLD